MRAVSLAVSAIPSELRSQPQWVVWRWESRDGKPTKPPYQPTGQHASSTDLGTWVSFEKALASYEQGGFDGIGFVLTAEDPFAIVDLDHCIGDGGQLTSEAAQIVSQLSSYTEVTPSGEGLRVIVKGKLPPGGRKRGNVEVYESVRYVTVTGSHYPGTPTTIEERTEALALLHSQVFSSQPTVSAPTPRSAPVGDDQELIARGMAARNGDGFRRLWDGDWESLGYFSQSEADLALCSHLAFWTRGDPERMDRLFRQSSLYDGKWDKPHFGDGTTYGQATIAKALQGGNAGQPIPTAPGSAPWPSPLEADAFYGLAGDVVAAIRPHTEADDAALLVNFLTAFGNAVDRGPHAIAEADRHGCNLFAVLVGETAKGRKGSSWGHIRELFTRADPTWAGDHVVQGLSSGEGLIWAVRDPIERVVPVKEKGRPTGESETIVEDQGVADKRLLVLETEYASVLRVMAREGNTLSPVLRGAWDTGDLRTLTKNSPARAKGAHISVIGHITKGELLRYLNDTEAGNGFGNRFLWTCARRARVLPEGGGTVSYGSLVERLHTALERGRKMGRAERDTLARQLWAEVYPEVSEGRSGLLGAITARAEAQVLRLSLLYAVLDGADAIGAAHLKAALAVWEYCEASAKFIFGDATGDPVGDRILRALRLSGELTRTAISNLFNRNEPAARIEHALRALEAAGLAWCEMRTPADGSGRPSEVWRG